MKRKLIFCIMAICMLGVAAVGCGETAKDPEGEGGAAIAVLTREEGSGTRSAFVELMGILDENDVDQTTVEASQTNSTAVMMTTVSNNPDAIGYISLGSMSNTVKALKIDGVEATAENVKAGTYKVSRPFNVAYQEETLSESAKDFLAFIMSAEGQKVIADEGYVAADSEAAAYAGVAPTEKIVVAGSSSVTPVMEKLKEAYLAIYPDAQIEIQQSDSSTGMKNAMEGTCDLGMASRELKDSEKQSLASTVIALDGIAVIVNNENAVNELTSEQVRAIFTGEITNWADVK